MTTQSSKESPLNSRRKALTAGLLVVGTLAASLMLAVKPAHAADTFTVDQTANKVAAGQTITATATDSAGNTSEFSAPRMVVAS